MCDKAVVENGRTICSWQLEKSEMCNQFVNNYVDALNYVSECLKTQEMCDKAVDIHPLAIQFDPECFKTQGMCDKAVDTCTFVFDFILAWHKTQKMFVKTISEYCLYKYKTQEVFDKAAYNFLPTLKFVSYWFVKSKIIKKLYRALFTDDDILFFDEDSSNFTFWSD